MPETIVDLGSVETAIAVREGAPAPAVTDEASLRAALLAADAIYFPDRSRRRPAFISPMSSGASESLRRFRPACEPSRMAQPRCAPNRRRQSKGDRLHAGHRDQGDAGRRGCGNAPARFRSEDGLYSRDHSVLVEARRGPVVAGPSDVGASYPAARAMRLRLKRRIHRSR